MTTAQHIHTPTSGQLWLKQRCINVEKQFNHATGRLTFAIRFIPLAALLVFAYWNGLQTAPLIAPWIFFPVEAVAFYLTLLVLSHRFHDIGLSGANLLQIILPAFIWIWVGGDLMNKVPPPIWGTTAAILAAWPVVVLLRLFSQRSKPAADNSTV